MHDYFPLCPDYTLMRNSVSSCGAPPVGSPGCRICNVGEHRRAHLERLRLLFSEVPFTMIAPSEFALKLWQGATDLTYGGAIVHEHCEIRSVIQPIDTQKLLASKVNELTASPLNVAFLGMPNFHKGWSIFADAARDLAGNPDFSFHHLGKSKAKGPPPGIAFTPVAISPGNWDAMSAAVRSKKIDIAMLCSLWPETYNFTAVEALAGGALIVTLQSSGNIAAIVRAHDCGVVFEDEMALRRAFADGSLAQEMRRRMRQNRPHYELAHRNMTADLFSFEDCPSYDRSLLHEHLL